MINFSYPYLLSIKIFIIIIISSWCLRCCLCWSIPASIPISSSLFFIFLLSIPRKCWRCNPLPAFPFPFPFQSRAGALEQRQHLGMKAGEGANRLRKEEEQQKTLKTANKKIFWTKMAQIFIVFDHYYFQLL